MKQTKLLIITLLATLATLATFAQSTKKDTTERRLILNLSQVEVAQLQAQLDNVAYFVDRSDLPHQKVKAIAQVCQSLQEKIEGLKREQWPANADTSHKSKK